MRVDIIKLTTIYPMVYVVEEGSFDNSTMSANVVCKVHIDDAEKIQAVLNA